ncbi:MAG: GntR family transcriptional regulator [Deltaproteobacteria bacterium]|nr:GntR family transcriptional regulator [Deltaproteobacteria bacterium]
MLLNLKDLNNEDFKPLYVQLADVLAEHIQQNRLQPGDPIPSENDLIQRYAISRMTVRIAMQRLETEGIIKKIQGRGTFVAEPKFHDYVKGVRSLEETFAE